MATSGVNGKRKSSCRVNEKVAAKTERKLRIRPSLGCGMNRAGPWWGGGNLLLVTSVRGPPMGCVMSIRMLRVDDFVSAVFVPLVRASQCKAAAIDFQLTRYSALSYCWYERT